MGVFSDILTDVVLKGLLPLIILPIAYYGLRIIYRAFQALKYCEEALKAVARENDNGLLKEGPGFWLKQPIVKPKNYAELPGSIPVLLIAATKGGVGKTSLAGSLAAHFAMRWTQQRETPERDKPLRVLVIDQDFQGSFTTMTVDGQSRYAQPSKSNRLVSGNAGQGGIVDLAERISQPGMISPLSIWVIPSYYDLAQAENRMLIEWLLPLSDEDLISKILNFLKIRETVPRKSKSDVRYLLAEALLDARVQLSFDLVIVDSPPRLTTSHIQAMCASTHLLVPTILDGLSGDAVARYLDQIAIHKLGPIGNSKLQICPYLEPIAVVCTMVPNTKLNLTQPINILRSRIDAARIRAEIVPEDCFIRQRTQYREHAGERIAFAALSRDKDHQTLREEVDSLGDWLALKLGSQGRGWRRN